MIAEAAGAATALAEEFTRHMMICRDVTMRVSASGAWRLLPAGPVAAIVAVAANDRDGAPIALASDGYAIDIDASGDGWVRTTAGSAAASLTVTARAGLAGDWASLPAALRQGIVMLATHLLERRDADAAPPAAVTALWRPYRRMRLDARGPA